MNADMQNSQIEAMKKMILRRILDKNALERLGRVKIANPVLASQVELYLLQLYNAGQIRGIISDAKLKEILNVLVAKKEWRIRRQS